jgi:hypothetical protein
MVQSELGVKPELNLRLIVRSSGCEIYEFLFELLGCGGVICESVREGVE